MTDGDELSMMMSQMILCNTDLIKLCLRDIKNRKINNRKKYSSIK
jgi:hypothetical protein